VPAWTATRGDVAGLLKGDTAARSPRTRGILVAGQLALSLVLLVGAALLARSAARRSRDVPARRVRRRRDRDCRLPADGFPDTSTLRIRLIEGRADTRFALIVLASFAIVALVLTAVGVYGVVAYSTARRMREIAVRRASVRPRPTS
jgi:hypothetical protein